MKKQITGDMTISEVLEKYPKYATEIADIMFSHGMHCVGCPAAQFETLKQGFTGHGMKEKDFEKLLKDLNKLVSKK